MDDAARVRRAETVEELLPDLDDVADGEPPLPHRGLHVLAGEELLDHVRRAALAGLACVEDRDDHGMADRGRRARLAHESAHRLTVPHHVVVQDLHSDEACGELVVGLVDGARAPRAEEPTELVFAVDDLPDATLGVDHGTRIHRILAGALKHAGQRKERAGALLVGLAALLAVVAQGWLVATTLSYPWQLEWMEAGLVETALRLRDGLPVYPAPSVDFVGYVYTPGYFAVVAAVSSVTGGDLITARVVSLVATIASLAIVCAHAQRDTQRWWLAAGAAGLLAASQGVAGFFLHLARVDALALALLLGAIFLIAHGRGARSAVGAGVVAAAAVLTKQSHLIALAPAVAGLAFVDARRAAIAALTSAALVLGSFAALTAATGGWFLYYSVDLPGQHGLMLGDAALHGLVRLLPLAPALALCVWSLTIRLRAGEARAKLDGAIFAGLLVDAWLGLAHSGGWWNTLLPACAAVALFTPGAIRATRTSRLSWLMAAQIALPLIVHAPAGATPGEGDRAQADRFLAWLREQPGEVLVPDLRIGQAARDVLMASPEDRGRRMLEESLATALAEQRFGTIVTTERDWLGGALELAYEPRGRIEGPPVPPIGAPRAPSYLFVPRAH